LLARSAQLPGASVCATPTGRNKWPLFPAANPPLEQPILIQIPIQIPTTHRLLAPTERRLVRVNHPPERQIRPPTVRRDWPLDKQTSAPSAGKTANWAPVEARHWFLLTVYAGDCKL